MPTGNFTACCIPEPFASLRPGEQNISGDVLIVVQAFFGLSMAGFASATLALTLFDIDIVTALSAVAST